MFDPQLSDRGAKGHCHQHLLGNQNLSKYVFGHLRRHAFYSGDSSQAIESSDSGRRVTKKEICDINFCAFCDIVPWLLMLTWSAFRAFRGSTFNRMRTWVTGTHPTKPISAQFSCTIIGIGSHPNTIPLHSCESGRRTGRVGEWDNLLHLGMHGAGPSRKYLYVAFVCHGHRERYQHLAQMSLDAQPPYQDADFNPQINYFLPPPSVGSVCSGPIDPPTKPTSGQRKKGKSRCPFIPLIYSGVFIARHC